MNTTVLIPAGGSIINITIPIQDDSISLEAVERVGYWLELPEGVTEVTVGTPDTTYVNVIDDDGECVSLCEYERVNVDTGCPVCSILNV